MTKTLSQNRSEAGIELPPRLQTDADLHELDKFVAQLIAELAQ